ncbi:MAG: ABC transporter ATP-binding protein, partial [Angustibacter sp.]
MAEGVKSAEEKAAEARRGPARRPGGPMAMGQPGEKSLDFGPSAKRLLGLLRPERTKLVVVVTLAVVSVLLSSVGPKILGRATDIIFAGFIGSKLPAGITKEQAVAGVRASGNTTQAELLSNVDFIPGVGIDFEALKNVLLLVVAIFAVASFLMWIQGWILQGLLQ